MSLVISLLLAASHAAAWRTAPTPPAPDWRPVGSFQGRFNLFYDASRIERGAKEVTIWFRSEAAQSARDAPWSISRVEIRCAAATVRVVATISYLPGGSVARTDTVPQPFQSIPPGSFVAAIQRDVCNAKRNSRRDARAISE